MTKLTGFDIYGLVHPKEYDWKKDFKQLANHLRRKPQAYILVDAGKLMGLCKYLEELDKTEEV